MNVYRSVRCGVGDERGGEEGGGTGGVRRESHKHVLAGCDEGEVRGRVRSTVRAVTSDSRIRPR